MGRGARVDVSGGVGDRDVADDGLQSFRSGRLGQRAIAGNQSQLELVCSGRSSFHLTYDADGDSVTRVAGGVDGPVPKAEGVHILERSGCGSSGAGDGHQREPVTLGSEGLLGLSNRNRDCGNDAGDWLLSPVSAGRGC